MWVIESHDGGIPTTPHERIALDPGDQCPRCSEPLRLFGEDISEIIAYIAAKLKVVETVRLKKSCRCCEKVVQSPRRRIRSIAACSAPV